MILNIFRFYVEILSLFGSHLKGSGRGWAPPTVCQHNDRLQKMPTYQMTISGHLLQLYACLCERTLTHLKSCRDIMRKKKAFWVCDLQIILIVKHQETHYWVYQMHNSGVAVGKIIFIPRVI